MQRAHFESFYVQADEESESDSDTEIDFNDRVRGEGLVAAPTNAAKVKSGSPEKNGKEDSPSKSDDAAAAAAKDEEDDVDIDDI